VRRSNLTSLYEWRSAGDEKLNMNTAESDRVDDDAVDEESGSDGTSDRHFVTALARGLEVLSCFKTGNNFLANHEIAQKCGLPRSTVTRLTYTLTKLGYLHLVPNSGKYRLGTATVALGSAMLAKLDVRQVARPFMQSLAAETEAIVALSTRDRLSMLYLECCKGSSIVTLSLDVGSRIPLGTTAAGRALLAGLPASERSDLMERIRALDDAAWPAISAGIVRAVDEYEATGCCSSLGDWVKGVHGIAVPFNPGRGLPVMVMSVAGAAQAFPKDQLMHFASKLITMVKSIEENLGKMP
jgi:DNA-binding IclR family transcriptional regulator